MEDAAKEMYLELESLMTHSALKGSTQYRIAQLLKKHKIVLDALVGSTCAALKQTE